VEVTHEESLLCPDVPKRGANFGNEADKSFGTRVRTAQPLGQPGGTLRASAAELSGIPGVRVPAATL
jgi:hypothetical protein